MLEKFLKSIQAKVDQIVAFAKANPQLVIYLLVAVAVTIYLSVIAFALNLALLVGLVLEEKEGKPSMSGESLMNGVLPVGAMILFGIFLGSSFAIMVAPTAGVFLASAKANIKNPISYSVANLQKAIIRMKNMKQTMAKADVEVKAEAQSDVNKDNKDA